MMAMVRSGTALSIGHILAVGVGDGIVDTQDNCPVDSNPGQEDLDNDGAGDVCDSNDGPLLLTSVVVRRARAARQMVRIKARIAAGSGGFFDPRAGASATLQDGAGFALATSWPASVCVTGRRGTRCKSPDRNAVLLVKQQRGGPQIVSVRLWRQSIQLPAGQTLTVTFSYGAAPLDRVGTATSCSLHGNTLRCR